MLDFMVNHSYFFIFVTWISLIIFFNFWWYSRKCWQKKLKLWWYSWNAKKKNWNHLLARLGPRGSAPASAPPLGPSLASKWFQFILFLHFMKPPKFQFFCQHFRETTKKNQWNQVTKKMNGFVLEVFFGEVNGNIHKLRYIKISVSDPHPLPHRHLSLSFWYPPVPLSPGQRWRHLF